MRLYFTQRLYSMQYLNFSLFILCSLNRDIIERFKAVCTSDSSFQTLSYLSIVIRNQFLDMNHDFSQTQFQIYSHPKKKCFILLSSFCYVYSQVIVLLHTIPPEFE